jgi:hypothetical protein
VKRISKKRSDAARTIANPRYCSGDRRRAKNMNKPTITNTLTPMGSLRAIITRKKYLGAVPIYERPKARLALAG